MSRTSDLKECECEAHALKEALHEKLKKGWNPNVPDLPELQCEDYLMTWSKTLIFALEKKKNSLYQNTYFAYGCTVTFINAIIDTLNLKKLLIADTKHIRIKLIMEKAKTTPPWSNYASNKNLNYLKAILNELIQWTSIEINPAHTLNNLPVAETNANAFATSKEQSTIKEYGEANHYSMTENYAKKVKEVYRNQIMENLPEF